MEKITKLMKVTFTALVFSILTSCGFSPNPCNCLKAQAEENNEQIKACEDKFVELSFQERADWINELSNCN